MDIVLRNNKYDTFLFVIIVSTIYGRWGWFHPTTLLSIFFLPQLLKNSNILKLTSTKIFVSFLMFWLAYAFLSLVWTPKLADGCLDIFFLFIHVILFLEIIVFSFKANNPLQTIAKAWVCAFLLTSVIAMWEIISGNHLLSAREESDAFVESRGDTYASVTFYNPNTYCYFMCLSFPFILYTLSQSKGWGIKNMVIVLLVIFIMSRNSSRGGLLSLLIMSSTYFIFKFKGGTYRKKLLLFLGLLVVLVLFVLYGHILLSTLFNRLSDKDMLEDNARLILWLSSWLGFVDSYGFGKGVGSMFYILEHSQTNIYTVIYSHNMILEILLEYGLIIFIGFILFLMKMFKNARKTKDKSLKSIIICSLLSFPFYSVINSENLRPHFIWVFFATLYVMSDFDVKNRMKNESFIRNKRLPIGRGSNGRQL